MNADDLQFYATENMTDTDDSGGYPSNNRVLDNVDNNVFPDIASGDRIQGRTHLRKIVAAVRSPDTETLMAARVYIASPPSDPAVSVGLLVTGDDADTRSGAVETLYTASQKNLNTNLRLYQTYYEGETVISVYAFTTQDAPFIGVWPKVGEILCLEDDGAGVSQYVRVSSISTSVVGNYQSAFITFDPPLRYPFAGGYNATSNYVTPTQIYNTRSIPMSHGVYGITPLAITANAGDTELRVETLNVSIAPTIIDTVSASLRPSANPVPKTKSVAAVDSRMQSTTLSPMPDLDEISVASAQGTISGAASPGLFAVSGNSITVTLPESPFSNRDHTHTPTITSTSVSSYSYSFGKALQTGSVGVQAIVTATSAIVVAHDNGAGGFTGAGISGTINYATGGVALTFSAAVTLNSLQITAGTIEDAAYYGQGSAISTTSSIVLNYVTVNRPLVPSSITVTANKFSNGALITGTDNGVGVISGTGIGSGNVSYSFSGDSGNAVNFTEPVYTASLKVQYQYIKSITVAISNGYYPVSSYSATLSGYVIEAGKVTVTATTPTGTVLTATDNGAGAFNHDGITGTVNYSTGAVALSFASAVIYSSLSIRSESRVSSGNIVWQYGTAADGDTFIFMLKTPIQPGSLDVSATGTTAGALLSVTDNGAGALSGDATGTMSYSSGQLSIVFSESVAINSIVIAYQYTAPSAANQLIGGTLDVVRLPASKSYPLVKPGDMAVIHYPKSSLLPNPVVAETTYSLGRTNVQQIWLEDATGTRIPTAKYTENLIAGAVTMGTGLNLSGYTQPLTAWTVLSDEALVTQIDATNRVVRLNQALTHDYPAAISYLSSQIPVGDLQATVTVPFSQQSWTSVWQNVRIGAEITPQYNQTVYPIVVSNQGAITERWRFQFTGTTTVNVIGEHVGQIASGLSITSVIAPINPQTGTPYFTIPLAGWGAGWVNGNLLRFNTVGSYFSFWPIRCVQPSEHIPGASDRFRLTLIGDVDA